jgi:hypothetical protein
MQSCRLMSKGSNFIERDVFERMISRVPRLDGGELHDTATVYGNMSRLVVSWLAITPPEGLRALYNELGWKGSANVRTMHETAKVWLAEHRADGNAPRQD